MELFTHIKLFNLSYSIGLFILGFFIAKRLRTLTQHTLQKRFTPHHAMLASRLMFYAVFLIFMVSSLQQMGFNLQVLLGAAGLLTVAISFASQTAASNLVSGIFLLFEAPFKVGDIIEVKGITGTIDAMDLLSTKIKTSEGTRVRIANEAMIKAEIINLSYYPTRRVEITVLTSFNNNIHQVKTLLLNIASQCPYALDKTIPIITLSQFSENAMTFKLMLWVNSDELTEAQSYLQEKIKQGIEETGIELPTKTYTPLPIYTDRN